MKGKSGIISFQLLLLIFLTETCNHLWSTYYRYIHTYYYIIYYLLFLLLHTNKYKADLLTWGTEKGPRNLVYLYRYNSKPFCPINSPYCPPRYRNHSSTLSVYSDGYFSTTLIILQLVTSKPQSLLKMCYNNPNRHTAGLLLKYIPNILFKKDTISFQLFFCF